MRLGPSIVLVLVLPFVAGADEGSAAVGPVVPGFARFHEAGADPVRGGQLLLGELNCTSCHSLDKSASALVLPKKAPLLSQVAARAKLPWLRAFIAAPHEIKPGTTMPDLFAGMSTADKQPQVEALVHYLATTAPGPLVDQQPDRGAVKRGETLFHQVGCVACHGPRNKPTSALTTSVPLGKPEAKYTIVSLTSFLRDPLAVRPSGRMPGLGLSDQEARDIATYFLKDVEGVPNLSYQWFEGGWDKLPDFSKLKPKGQGTASGFDLDVTGRKSNFSMRFEGFLALAKDGKYKFHLGSDDGSKLYIDGALIVDCDGTHAHSWQSGETRLTAGTHAIRVEFFNGGGDQSLEADFEGPGVARQSLAAAATLVNDPSRLKRPGGEFVLDPALVETGRELFTSVGCASCHELRESQPVKVKSPQLKSLPLTDVDPTRGCLAGAVARPAPHYALSPLQREALAAGIKSLAAANLPTPTNPDVLVRTLTAFNCYACHVRDNIGGVETARNDYFYTTVKEMGDEGRIPPSLNGVGNKLTDNWFKKVFEQGAKDRPYMLTRMPRFGNGNVGSLTAAFQAADPVDALPAVSIDLPDYKVKSIGRHMVGNKAFACTKCHNFDKHKGEGIPGIDMTILTQRLRQDWFGRYVRDPQTFRPGTRMPSPWPKTGPSQLGDIFGGDSDQQIASIWAYLADGTKASPPLGTGSHPIELVVSSEPVIYRNFIEGSGPRAIGVGYPEKVNLSFDANNLRLALLWHGAFIDAGRHWEGRGAGFQPPLGDHVLPLADGVPFAQLADSTGSWPTGSAKEQGYQFRGYRLDEARRPTFLYSWNGAMVEDFALPVPGKPDAGCKRTLTISTSKPLVDTWFRAAVAKEIKPVADGWHLVDGLRKLRLESAGGTTVVREINKKTELLVPIVFEENKAQVVQEFEW